MGEDFAAHQRYFNMMKDIKQIVVPFKTKLTKVRVGDTSDGAYVIASDIDHKICYSYGVGDNNIQFEQGLYDLHGIVSYAYDHTIDGIKNKPDYINYKKEGISHVKTIDCDTILNHILQNGHDNERNMLLKIDVEGAEWPVLSSKLDRF